MTDTTIAINRTFDAPRELVFAAWTDPAQFAAWFGSDPERTTLDVKPGGEWKAIMHYEGKDMPFWGEFREIDPPGRLVLTFTDNPEGFGLVTVLLTEVEGRTEMAFTQTGPLPEDQLEAATQGWGFFFDSMEQVLAKAA